MRYHLSGLSVLFGLIISFSTQASSPASPQSPIAQDFTLDTLTGDSFQLSAHSDQPVLIVFWATWCPYCKRLLPGIERINSTYKDKGLKVIGITINEDGDPAAYMKRYGYTFTVGLNGDHLKSAYHVSGTPTIVVLEKNNRWRTYLTTSDPHSRELESAVRISLGLQPLP